MVNFYTDADLTGSGEFVEATVTLATEFTVPDGTINSIRARFPAVAGSAPVARVYTSGGSSLMNQAFDTTTADAWNSATSSISVLAGTYRVCQVVTRYVAKGGFFSGGSITRNGITGVQGRFDSGNVAPTQTSTATYFVDIDFTAGSGSVAGTANLAAVSTLTAGGIVTELAAAPLTAGATLTAGGTRIQPAAAALIASSVLTAAGTRQQFAVAPLSAVSALAASAGAILPGAAALTAASVLTAAATRVQPVAAALVAAATLTAAGQRTAPAAAPLAAGATLTAAGQRTAVSIAALTASSVLTATGQTGPIVPYSTATLTPGASAAATLSPGTAAAAVLTPGTAAAATLIAGNL